MNIVEVKTNQSIKLSNYDSSDSVVKDLGVQYGGS